MVRYVVPASKKLVVTLSQIVIFGVNEVGNIHVYRLFELYDRPLVGTIYSSFYYNLTAIPIHVL